MNAFHKPVRGREAARLHGVRPDHVTVAAGVAQQQSPVLPAGWAPLTRDQQLAVLQACDRTPIALLFRIGAANPGTEYRVYRLDEEWAGLCVAAVYESPAEGLPPLNCELVALAVDDGQAVAVVLSRINAELASRDASFVLALSVPAVLPEDPRRV